MAVTARKGNTYRAQIEYTDSSTSRLVRATVLLAADSIEDVMNVFTTQTALTIALGTVASIPSGLTTTDINVFSIQRVESGEDVVAISDGAS